MSISRGRKIWIAAAIAALATMSFTAFAPAEDVTKESYAAKAEPICKKNTLANKKIFRGVRKMVQRNQLGKAAKRFRRAARSLNSTVRKLAHLPRPVGEEARLKKWVKYLKVQRNQLGKIAKALAHNNKFQAQSQIIKLRRTSNRANNTVLSYDFNFCKVNPSRFT